MNRFHYDPHLAVLAKRRDSHRAIADQCEADGFSLKSLYHRQQVARAVAELHAYCMAALATFN